jgi:indolepyruvate ferredoxin oxidoreductase beta subunit
MGNGTLTSDPYNLIIAGVGGQGNVLASRVLGGMLTGKGFRVTIGDTFGASQRGGSVMSHIRISADSNWSPQIPKGRAHMIIALEPAEAVRVLGGYGNPKVQVLCNTRPIHPVGVICGELAYPSLEDIETWVLELSARAWFLDATNAAMKLGNPIFGNIMMIGALGGTGALPIDRGDFEAAISRDMSPDKVKMNLTAYDMGAEMVKRQQAV